MSDRTRYRDVLIKEMVGHKNRIEKHLQQYGFKLSTILSDIFGMSGTLLVKRLCEKGALDERDVGECLKGTLRGKVSEVRRAVAGKLSEHDRIFLTNLLKVKENCDREIEDVEQRITGYSEKYEPAMQVLETIPAVQRRASAIIISELGVDLSMFQIAGHLCKWAGLCPGDNESAKKKKSCGSQRAIQGSRALCANVRGLPPAARNSSCGTGFTGCGPGREQKKP